MQRQWQQNMTTWSFTCCRVRLGVVGFLPCMKVNVCVRNRQVYRHKCSRIHFYSRCNSVCAFINSHAFSLPQHKRGRHRTDSYRISISWFVKILEKWSVTSFLFLLWFLMPVNHQIACSLPWLIFNRLRDTSARRHHSINRHHCHYNTQPIKIKFFFFFECMSGHLKKNSCKVEFIAIGWTERDMGGAVLSRGCGVTHIGKLAKISRGKVEQFGLLL